MKKVEKSARAFDMAKNITDIGPLRKQWVNGFDEITVIAEGTLMGFCAGADASSPGSDSSKVTARVDAFVMRAEDMYQVTTSGRSRIGVAYGTHEWE